MFETVLNFCQITEVPTDMDVKVRYPPTTETGILRTKVEPTTTKTTGTVTQIVEDIVPPNLSYTTPKCEHTQQESM